MTLHVFGARICTRDPDRLDVTRKSGTDGLFLAPSWAILRPALDALKVADALIEETLGLDPVALQSADTMRTVAWERYTADYLHEMRRSYREHRAAWEALLARHRVVLCCYCTDPLHCHRYLLRAVILPKLGAIDCGELVS